MEQELTAVFYDEESDQELIASGIYHPEEKGGWLDGQRSEPYEPHYIELVDITDLNGGAVDWEPVEHEAMKALWNETEEFVVEDW